MKRYTLSKKLKDTITKVLIILNVFYDFNVFPMQSPLGFFMKLETLNLKFIWKVKGKK